MQGDFSVRKLLTFNLRKKDPQSVIFESFHPSNDFLLNVHKSKMWKI